MSTGNAAPTKAFTVWNSNATTTCKEVFRVFGTGFVDAKDLRVKIDDWCDYVFKPDYVLPTLNDLNVFLQKNNHLPGVPSQKEINENGLVVTNMFKLQMQKIEELTLYIIQQNEKIETLEKDIKLLKQQTTHNAKGGSNAK